MGRKRKYPEHEIHLGKDGYAYDSKERHKKIIAARGETCTLCGYKPEPGADRWHGVDVDHIDGNRANYASENLRVLCHSCNVKEQMKCVWKTRARLSPEERRRRIQESNARWVAKQDPEQLKLRRRETYRRYYKRKKARRLAAANLE
jgi:hypothetical protein